MSYLGYIRFGSEARSFQCCLARDQDRLNSVHSVSCSLIRLTASRAIPRAIRWHAVGGDSGRPSAHLFDGCLQIPSEERPFQVAFAPRIVTWRIILPLPARAAEGMEGKEIEVEGGRDCHVTRISWRHFSSPLVERERRSLLRRRRMSSTGVMECFELTFARLGSSGMDCFELAFRLMSLRSNRFTESKRVIRNSETSMSGQIRRG